MSTTPQSSSQLRSPILLGSSKPCAEALSPSQRLMYPVLESDHSLPSTPCTSRSSPRAPHQPPPSTPHAQPDIRSCSPRITDAAQSQDDHQSRKRSRSTTSGALEQDARKKRRVVSRGCRDTCWELCYQGVCLCVLCDDSVEAALDAEFARICATYTAIITTPPLSPSLVYAAFPSVASLLLSPEPPLPRSLFPSPTIPSQT
ncbi:hypothetical protein C2E23DRAFT_824095 [Lenzites betulinus]|nr:hypothetical protein C2E23DRAFT_824095 [Lenzites betulinus]